jgi:asparagine synthase (glutamine-hydrolysing)
MCGIAGFAGEHRERIERMTQALTHRGPDGNAFVLTHGASFGHARLAILDPRPVGDQPMWNDNKTVIIVFNGEILNYRELRDKEGFVCKTGTDTEILLKMYDKYGIDFVHRLRGMFAFGLYDCHTKTWYLARDPSGIKPLFVAYPEGKLHFASEMRSLLSALPTKPAINEAALSQYLRLQYVPGPHTLCDGIESLPPGTVLTWHDGHETRRHVEPQAKSYTFTSKRAFMEEFPSIMDDSVAHHMISDKPIGIFLSGGMDSSIVLHHMAQHASGPVKTFTVRFEATAEEGEERFNTDANLAKKTAEYYGTDHHEIFVSAADCRRVYKDTARALDQPNADAVSVAQYLLAEEAKKHVDVILNGSGGDELFGGYPRYRVARVLHTLRSLPPSLRKTGGRLTGHPSDVLGMQPGSALAERLLARPLKELQPLIRGNWFQPQAVTHLFNERFHRLDAKDPIRQFMEFDRHLWLVDESLRLADATTMAHGVEGRVPFLDPEVIAAAHVTPGDWHVGIKRTKALLKDTYRPLLPEHLFTLAKASFYPPLAKWFRRDAAILIEETLEQPRIRERFDTDAIREVFERHKNGGYALHTLSTLAQLGYWFETVYDA